MLVRIPDFLSVDRLTELRARLDAGPWIDGRGSARGDARRVKHNEQLDGSAPEVRALHDELLATLGADPRVRDAVWPANVSRFLFARYRPGMAYGPHLDLPLMGAARGGQLRTDLALTLHLDDPATYEGGELWIHGDLGPISVRGEAGELVIYPANTVHEVRPVTRGERRVAVAWMQSLVPDPGRRAILADLLAAARSLEAGTAGEHPPAADNATEAAAAATQRVRRAYYNLLRAWAETPG